MELTDFQSIIRVKLTTYRRLWVMAFFLLSLSPVHIVKGQNSDKVEPINQLHEGTLIVRFPTYRTKIDTLEALIGRSTSEQNKQRLQRLLQETIDDRDTLFEQYKKAFKENYNFSKTAYIFDYDARNMNTAHYFNMDSERLALADLMEKPLFYLFFERTEESKIDAMVIYDRKLQKVPYPFPNNFAQGGLNLFIVKISEKKFPSWRVGKMNKRFWKYYHERRAVSEGQGAGSEEKM